MYHWCGKEEVFENALRDAEIKYQLVPPHNPKPNLSEWAIQTLKGNFKEGLVSLVLDFSISEWDRIVEQGKFTLDLLWASRSNPKLSAYAYLLGKFDYSATPLVPLVQIH